ncbi:MAG: hypothetical protein ABIG89_05895 [Candidatus Woesearchaeota archaeon]
MKLPNWLKPEYMREIDADLTKYDCIEDGLPKEKYARITARLDDTPVYISADIGLEQIKAQKRHFYDVLGYISDLLYWYFHGRHVNKDIAVAELHNGSSLEQRIESEESEIKKIISGRESHTKAAKTAGVQYKQPKAVRNPAGSIDSNNLRLNELRLGELSCEGIALYDQNPEQRINLSYITTPFKSIRYHFIEFAGKEYLIRTANDHHVVVGIYTAQRIRKNFGTNPGFQINTNGGNRTSLVTSATYFAGYDSKIDEKIKHNLEKAIKEEYGHKEVRFKA